MVLAIAGAMGRARGWADSRAMSRPTAEGMSRVIFSVMYICSWELWLS
jgi:hypothetical protein